MNLKNTSSHVSTNNESTHGKSSTESTKVESLDTARLSQPNKWSNFTHSTNMDLDEIDDILSLGT